MDITDPEILSHIQDRQDRHTLNELLKKYEVLRVRLLVKPPGLESDRAAIEDLKRRLGLWELWYEATTAQMRKLYSQNKELQAKITGLEDNMKRLLLAWKPPTDRRLFQGSARARTRVSNPKTIRLRQEDGGNNDYTQGHKRSDPRGPIPSFPRRSAAPGCPVPAGHDT